MRRQRWQQPNLSRAALLLGIPLLVSGTGYALFSQNLSLSGASKKPAYSATQYTLMTYTKTVTQQGSVWLYSMPMTVKNNGATRLTAWQVKFDVPADTAQLTCPTSVTCSRAGNTVTINNGAANGTLNASASTTFTISFTTAVNLYTLQNVLVSGTYSTAWQSITGLTVSATQGTRTKSGNRYTWRVTITVTNSTGQPISTWQVRVPWATGMTYAPTTPPAGISYAVVGATLQITRTTPLANGASYTLTTTPAFSVTSTNINYTTAGTTVVGKP
ncbi:MAG: cellulose binding domain-containing protein [Candidatus Saccharimonas sp.]